LNSVTSWMPFWSSMPLSSRLQTALVNAPSNGVTRVISTRSRILCRSETRSLR
jgi:hypothetical protein